MSGVITGWQSDGERKIITRLPRAGALWSTVHQDDRSRVGARERTSGIADRPRRVSQRSARWSGGEAKHRYPRTERTEHECGEDPGIKERRCGSRMMFLHRGSG